VSHSCHNFGDRLSLLPSVLRNSGSELKGNDLARKPTQFQIGALVLNVLQQTAWLPKVDRHEGIALVSVFFTTNRFLTSIQVIADEPITEQPLTDYIQLAVTELWIKAADLSEVTTYGPFERALSKVFGPDATFFEGGGTQGAVTVLIKRARGNTVVTFHFKDQFSRAEAIEEFKTSIHIAYVHQEP